MSLLNSLARRVAGLLIATLALPLFAQPLTVPPPPPIAAKAYLLTDYYSGTTLAENNADQRVEPASLTKLMTAYIVFQALKDGRLKQDQQVMVSEKAWKAEGSRTFIEPNKPVDANTLIHGLIIQSGNDAAIALAEAVAGSEETFAASMNQTAARLGMSATHFVNATGLPDPQHYTTARDLTRLAAAIIRDFPEYFPIYSQKEFTYHGIKQPNRNLLLWRDPAIDGMKTGHTDSAGFCLTATMSKNGRRVISVLLGAASETVRATESLKLLNYGMQFFDTPKLYSKGQTLQQVKVWKGADAAMPIGFARDVYLTVPRGAAKQLKAQLTTQQPLVAPVLGGQQVGKVTFTLDGKTVAETQVVALKQVGQAGVFGRMWDSMKLWFE